MNFALNNFSMMKSFSPFKWLKVTRSIKALVFDQTLAELKATMIRDGNFFWAISTN